MRSDASTTDRRPGPAGRLHGPWRPVGIAVAVLGGAYLLGINRNLLYLSMLLSTSVVLSVVLKRWWTLLLGLGACAYLAVAQANVDDLGVLYPAPRDIPGAENMWVARIGEGQTWSYRFTLGGVGTRGEGASAEGYLYIDGRGLSNLVVGVQGRTLPGSSYCSRKNGLDHLEIPLGTERAPALVVSLRGLPGASPRIFQGPEVHGFNAYSDAVWLEFNGNGVRAIYHAQRAAAASAPR